MKNLAILALLLAGQSFAAEKSLEERVEALEYAGYESGIVWRGYLESRFDQMTYKSEGQKDKKYAFHRLLGGLDLNVTANEKLSIFGRLSFAKFYNNQPNTIPDSNTAVASRQYADEGKVYIERFFLNYTPINWLSLTAGRLPTLDGPPRHLVDGRPRLGSYPMQIYSTALDGYAMTFIPQISAQQDLSLRYIYIPVSQIALAGATAPQNKIYETDVYPETTTEKSTVVEVNTWMVDYNIRGIGFARDFTAVYQKLIYDKVQVAPDVRGGLYLDVLYLELIDIGKVGVDLYSSYGKSSLKTRGGLVVGTDPTTGEPISIGLASAKGNSNVKGNSTIAGLKYRLPLKTSNAPSLGVEYVSGSKYWSNTTYTNEPFNYNDMRGKANQIYILQPIATGATLRIGMQQGRPKYTSGALGEPRETTDKFNNFYVNLRADF